MRKMIRKNANIKFIVSSRNEAIHITDQSRAFYRKIIPKSSCARISYSAGQ